MRLRKLALAAALVLAAPAASAAGFRFLEVPADATGPALRGAVWSPCALPAGAIALGPMILAGTPDCPIPGERLPLVLISHGAGGSFAGHHDTAEALADAGFVVAAISHPGDNYKDKTRQGDVSIFSTRPADMKRLLDFMLAGWPERARIDAGRIGLFGFSRGAATALILLGADPDFSKGIPICATYPDAPMCAQVRDGKAPAPTFVHDKRIRAVAIADPLALFSPESLKAIDRPVQLWASEFGGDGVTPDGVAAIAKALPRPPDSHVVAGAAHFAFLAPCPPAMAKALAEICLDAPEFDRAAFHERFDAEIVAFFRLTLGETRQP
jgi:predicted dienelactone hydrolase